MLDVATAVGEAEDVLNEPGVISTMDPSAIAASSYRVCPWKSNCCLSGGMPVLSHTFSLTYSMVSAGPISMTTLSSVEVTTVICLSLRIVVVACSIALVELVGLVVFLKDVDGAAAMEVDGTAAMEVDGKVAMLVDATSVVLIVDIGMRDVVSIGTAFGVVAVDGAIVVVVIVLVVVVVVIGWW